MNIISCKELTKTYGRNRALKGVSFSIEENKIIGLVGRNGAGKTTLLKLIAGYLKSTSGELSVFEKNPFNNLIVSSNICYVDEKMEFPNSLNLAEILETAGSFYTNWDSERASKLMEYFLLSAHQKHNSLSKGMRSTFNMIIGLCSNVQLTIYDEPTSGMDIAVRKDFYRALLKSYVERPRTIIISSHQISEIDDLVEELLLIKEGEVCLHKPIVELQRAALSFKGKSELVNNFLEGRELIHSEIFGNDGRYAVVNNDFNNTELSAIRNTGIDVLPVSIEDLIIYLTEPMKGGIDDVFNKN